MSGFNSGTGYYLGAGRGTLPLPGPSQIGQNAPGVTAADPGQDRNAALLAKAFSDAVDTGVGITRDITRQNLRARQEQEFQDAKALQQQEKAAREAERAQRAIDAADESAASLYVSQNLASLGDQIKDGAVTVNASDPNKDIERIARTWSQGQSKAYHDQIVKLISAPIAGLAVNVREKGKAEATDAAVSAMATDIVAGVPVADVAVKAGNMFLRPEDFRKSQYIAADALAIKGEKERLQSLLSSIENVSPVYAETRLKQADAAIEAQKNKQSQEFLNRYWGEFNNGTNPDSLRSMVDDAVRTGQITNGTAAPLYQQFDRQIEAIADSTAASSFMQSASDEVAFGIINSATNGPVVLTGSTVVLPSGKTMPIPEEQKKSFAIAKIREMSAGADGSFDIPKYTKVMNDNNLKDPDLQRTSTGFAARLDAGDVTTADVAFVQRFADFYRAKPGWAGNHVADSADHDALVAIAEIVNNDPRYGIKNAISDIRNSRNNVKVNGPKEKNPFSAFSVIQSQTGIAYTERPGPAVQSLARTLNALNTVGLTNDQISERASKIIAEGYVVSGKDLYRKAPLSPGVVENFDVLKDVILTQYAEENGKSAYPGAKPGFFSRFATGALNAARMTNVASILYTDSTIKAVTPALQGTTAKDFRLIETGDGEYGVYRIDGTSVPMTATFKAQALNAAWQDIQDGKYAEAFKAALERKNGPKNLFDIQTRAAIAKEAQDAATLSALEKERKIASLRLQGWTDSDLREFGYIQ